MLNKFYKYEGFKTNSRIEKGLFFYHVPKCAGSTFSVVMSHLFKKPYRIMGPFSNKNDKGGNSAYDNFLKRKNEILLNHYDFIYGHVPFELHNYFKKNYFFVTLLRDPIKRTLSHYNWALNHNYISKEDKFEYLLSNNIIPSNLMVKQFSGKYFLNKKNNLLELAENNLFKKINLLFDINEISILFNMIISFYNLPNLFLQNQNTGNYKHNFTNSQISIVKEYNELDIYLYKKFKKEKNKIKIKEKCKKCNCNVIVIKEKKLLCSKCNLLINKQSRRLNKYLYSSPNILLNNKKTSIINNNQLKLIEDKFIKKNIKIFHNE